MRDVLMTRFGFDPSHIELLTDAYFSLIMPTGANIKRALNEMVDKAEPGDVLFIHYSGHGTRISDHDHSGGRKDEAIVPCDFNLITDVDFRQLVNHLPRGASFTVFSDSCHSGGLINKEKEQIGPNTTTTTATGKTTSLSGKPKTIPLETILQHLSASTRINTPDVGTHLLHSFGDNASLRFRLPHHELDSSFEKLKADEGILLSGCQANETSADMDPSQGGAGKAYGAFSNAVQVVLRENRDSPPLSNREIVVLARKVLKAQRFEQHPCLYCSDENADATFLLQPHSYDL